MVQAFDVMEILGFNNKNNLDPPSPQWWTRDPVKHAHTGYDGPHQHEQNLNNLLGDIVIKWGTLVVNSVLTYVIHHIVSSVLTHLIHV